MGATRTKAFVRTASRETAPAASTSSVLGLSAVTSGLGTAALSDRCFMRVNNALYSI